jgi:hypothetical protein
MEVEEKRAVRQSVCAFLAASAVASGAFGGFVNPLVPVWRGGPGTQFSGWESYTAAFGAANAPDMADSSPLGSLFNFAPGSFITGSGNIYAPSSPLSIMALGGIGAPANPMDVVVNVAAAGTEINQASMFLTLADNAGNSVRLAPSATEVRSSVPFGLGGSVQTIAFSWSVAPLAFNAVRWQFDFSSLGPNTSLDAVSLDMRLVPGPGALSVLAVLLPGASRGRRRRL